MWGIGLPFSMFTRAIAVSTPRLLSHEDPCPCQSGKQFGSCCMRDGRFSHVNGIPTIQMAHPPTELVEAVRDEELRQANVGQIRHPIHAEWQGQRWIAVGGKLLSSAKWRAPVDFLIDYARIVMSVEWGKCELLKPLAERHPLMQFYESMRNFQRQGQRDVRSDGLVEVSPNGAMRAFLLFAYDLYALDHHSVL